MSSAETVYQVDQKRRIITCVITFFVVIVLYIALAYLFQTRMPVWLPHWVSRYMSISRSSR